MATGSEPPISDCRRHNAAAPLDRVLASAPVGVWFSLPLVIGGAAMGLIAAGSLLSAVVVAIVFAYAYRRFRSERERALAAMLADPGPRVRKIWQPRLSTVRRLIRQVSAASGVAAPRLLVEAGSSVEINAYAFGGDAGTVLLLPEAVLNPRLSRHFDERGLAGLVAHEIGHLRPGYAGTAQMAAAVRALRAAMLVGSLAACGLAGAPLRSLAVSVVAFGAMSLLVRLAARREEIEASLFAARILGVDGPAMVVAAVAQVSLCTKSLSYDIMPVRQAGMGLRAALNDAVGLGAAPLRTRLEAWPLESDFWPSERVGWRGRLAYARASLSAFPAGHPTPASLAGLLGLPERG